MFFSEKANGQTIDTLKTFDSNGNPKTMEFLENSQRTNYVLNYEYDTKNRITKEFTTDTLGEILPRVGLSEVITYEYEKQEGDSIKTTTYLDKNLNPSVNDQHGFHKVKMRFNNQNQIVEEWYFSESGETFQRIGFKYKDDLLSEVNYLSESGALSEDGIAIVKLEQDKEGRIIKETNFDSKMVPYHANSSPYITEIYYLDGVECKRFFNDKMVEIKFKKLSNCETISNFKLPNKAGKLIDINDQNGKIKIIHFWASWSRPCKYANEELVDLVNKLDGKEIEVISIALEKEGSQGMWVTAINATNLNWDKHLCDFKHWESKGAKEFGVESIPRFFVIDENGHLIGNDLNAVFEIEEILIKKGKL
jgi:thiol-disulfide isomerase/thioredoxin